MDLEGLVRVCGGWSVKAGDGAVGSAVRDRERKMRKCSGRPLSLWWGAGRLMLWPGEEWAWVP